MSHGFIDETSSVESEQLLSAVAEHLRRPLLYIRQEAELAQNLDKKLSAESIHISADSGLKLIEHYLTWQRFASSAQNHQTAQVGLTAVMQNVSNELRSIAKGSQTELTLRSSGKYAPVIVNSELLKSGMSALGLAFIEAAGEKQYSKVVFGVHRSRWGLVAGVYSPQLSIRADSFLRHKNLVGSARQLLPTSSHTTMSGVALADALFDQLSVKLRPSKHKGMDGLAITLTPSPQLSLL